MMITAPMPAFARRAASAIAALALPLTAGCELLDPPDVPTTTTTTPTQHLAVQFTERCAWRLDDGVVTRSLVGTTAVRRMSVVAPRQVAVGETFTVGAQEADRTVPLPDVDLGHISQLDVVHSYGGSAVFDWVGMRSLGGTPRGERVPPNLVVHRSLGTVFTPAVVEVDVVANGAAVGGLPLPLLGPATHEAEGPTEVRAATTAGALVGHCRPEDPAPIGSIEVLPAPTEQ